MLIAVALVTVYYYNISSRQNGPLYVVALDQKLASRDDSKGCPHGTKLRASTCIRIFGRISHPGCTSIDIVLETPNNEERLEQNSITTFRDYY